MRVLATPRGVCEEGDGGRRRARGGGGGGMRELEELLNIKDGKVVGALQCEPDERRQRADAIDRANARRRGGRRRVPRVPRPPGRRGRRRLPLRGRVGNAVEVAPRASARPRRVRALGSARPPAGGVRGFDALVTELVSDAVGR